MTDPREIFEDFLERLSAGEDVDIAQLVAAHPDHSLALRQLWAKEGERAEEVIEGTLEGLSFYSRRQGRSTEGPSPTAGQTLGDFRLLQLLGVGGMGQVWEAEQASLGRRVALKIVRPDRATIRALDLFAREARAGGRLRHPGLIAVYAHGEDGGVAWIAMELVEGSRSLRDFLDEFARAEDVPPTYYRDVAVFVSKLADALQAAHAAGVVHRDLKPQNILITPDNEPRITDFGLARITDESAITNTGDFAGTYFYMSPEQIGASRIGIDYRTDIFSLGVVLYEMLALRRPFEGDTMHQVARRILHEDPPELRSLRSRVPRNLAVICGKCLEKDKDRRYATMADLAADIRRHLANQPIVAQPPGRLRKLELWALRNPTRSVAGALASVAFVAVSLLLGENVRANRKLTQAVDERGDAIALLEDRTRALQAVNQDLVRERANLAAEVESVQRLSALQDLEELIERVDELWPPHPVNIGAYGKWLESARGLVADLPLHHAKRDELRALARPQTAEEEDADRRGHPEFPRLERLTAEIEARRAALARRRDGVAIELTELEWDDLPKDASALNELARPLIDPERATFRRESEGLSLAQRALELAESAADNGLMAKVEDTLSRALFALGRDEDALEASRRALAVAPAGEREHYEACLADLETWVEHARSVEGLRGEEREIARLEEEAGDMEEQVKRRRTWEFPDSAEGARWWHANLSRLIESLEGLQDAETGLLSASERAVSSVHGWSVPRRLAFAERLRDGLVQGEEWDRRWEEALAAIREHRLYGGLVLSRQVGLVPIGPDPQSGLWEFWHVATGAEPIRNERGGLLLTEETGVVLVLIPGGTSWMGAQSTDASGRNHDMLSSADEVPVHEVALSPYFMSKCEMTQGQWLRFTGHNPSRYGPGRPNPPLADLRHPVETVSWIDCMRELPRMGLTLPAEAQWEYGCRAGTETPWWTGEPRESLREHNAVNLADQAAARAGLAWDAIDDWPELDDGHVIHSPVATFSANPFGLHEVHGNLWEWCLDGYDPGFYGRAPRNDPVAPWQAAAKRVSRGGSLLNSAAYARSAARAAVEPSVTGTHIGVRPARGLSE